MIPRRPRSTLFPYTTLFRSGLARRKQLRISRIPFGRLQHGARILEQIGRHTSELQSRSDLVCRLLLEKKKSSRPSHLPPPDGQPPHGPGLAPQDRLAAAAEL